MKVIGLTGVFGSGKSTVARFLREQGAEVIDADEVAHEVYAPGTPGWQKLVDCFGNEILAPDGRIDRSRLGRLIFGSDSARSQLNHILLPLLTKRVKGLLKGYRQSDTRVVIVEAALLVEAGWLPLVDEVWLTYAPRKVIFQRLEASKGFSNSEVTARLRAQLAVSDLRRFANRVIDTDVSPERLQAKVRRLYQKTELSQDKLKS